MDKRLEKFLVLGVDFLAINLAWVLFFYIRVESGLFEILVQPEIILSMIAIYVYWLFLFIFVGMYRTWFAASRFDEMSTLFKASFVGIFILYFAILYDDSLEGVSSSTRFIIFIYWFIFLFITGLGRIFIRSFQRRLLINGIGRRNCLIVGFNKKAFEIQEKVEYHRGLGLDVVGFVSFSVKDFNMENKGKKVLGVYTEIKKIINETDSKEIILAFEHAEEDVLLSIVNDCDSENVAIKIVPDLYEIISGQARTSQIYGLPLIDIMPKLMPEWEKKIKRLMDIVISFIFLIFASPIIFITAVAIKLESKGPVFYKQERSGLNGKPFRIIKFRSMVQDAEKHSGPVWSSKNDPRITKTGRFIRRVRIDEIPQMINVLRGDMSMVGPRPERPFFVEKLSLEIPLYKRRLRVRPGITGWAQVKHKYDESIEDVKAKLRYDLFYIENMSLRNDFIILLRTVFVVLFGKGHYD
ncbi:MAG: sugar transferase [Ignavibacteriales bacterium CG_4_9_14_3_um_filter_34_10]|nr:MAG: sugar transferase [Ignavibacteriales bacterium CG_4_9_14_3_um_filter_34_10]